MKGKWSTYVHDDGAITVFSTREDGERQRAGAILLSPEVDGFPCVFRAVMEGLHGKDYVIGAYPTVRKAISDMMWMYENVWISLSAEDGA